jgi:hypothetical protein
MMVSGIKVAPHKMTGQCDDSLSMGVSTIVDAATRAPIAGARTNVTRSADDCVRAVVRYGQLASRDGLETQRDDGPDQKDAQEGGQGPELVRSQYPCGHQVESVDGDIGAHHSGCDQGPTGNRRFG